MLDALFYAFSPVIAAYLLRLLQRRTLLARLGKRTLIIADAAHVHRVMAHDLLIVLLTVASLSKIFCVHAIKIWLPATIKINFVAVWTGYFRKHKATGLCCMEWQPAVDRRRRLCSHDRECCRSLSSL